MNRIQPIIRSKTKNPTHIGVIELFYDQVKSKREEQLSLQEKDFVDQIEVAYKAETTFDIKETQGLLSQAYQILEASADRDEQQEIIFNVLEWVIELGEPRRIFSEIQRY